jgi:uncharacterized protein YciI
MRSANEAVSAMAFFHCRLSGPRPTFPADMSAEERALMGEHAAYLRSLAEQGQALFFGPVADPKGPWGLAIFEVEDEAAARRLTDNDPVIKSGRGFSYEILPLMQAVVGRRLHGFQQ